MAKTKEETKEYMRQWRKKNKEKLKLYYQEKKEYYRLYRKKYYQENGEKQNQKKLELYHQQNGWTYQKKNNLNNEVHLRETREDDLYQTREELMEAEERGEGRINWIVFDALISIRDW